MKGFLLMRSPIYASQVQHGAGDRREGLSVVNGDTLRMITRPLCRASLDLPFKRPIPATRRTYSALLLLCTPQSYASAQPPTLNPTVQLPL